MLAYILAVLVGTGSVGLYIAAFFFPEIHRKQDFIWSGVGFFYALTLWIYARQSMGGIVVGQTASVALLGWLAWQTLKLRRQLVPANQQTPLPNPTKIQQQLGLKPTVSTTTTPAPKTPIKSRSIDEHPTRTAPIQQAPTEVEPPISPPTVPVAEIGVDSTDGEEKASITLQLKPPATASKPIGQPLRPPAPPVRPQQGILAAGEIVVAPVDNSSNAIDLNLNPIEPIAKPVEPKDESSSNWE